MTKEEALEALSSSSQQIRLQAARFFSVNAQADDKPVLMRALQKENVPWIKRAIERALLQVQHTVVRPIEQFGADISDTVTPHLLRSIRADAINDVTTTLIHEFGPLVGSLKINASAEIESYEKSRTRNVIEKLGTLINAIKNLKQAAAAPAYRTFDLHELVSECVSVLEPNLVNDCIRLAGVKPYMIVADRDLLILAVINGIRNAVEAVEDYSSTKPPEILINWGPGGAETWLSIGDSGSGFTGSLLDALAAGNSNKKDHFGYGLAIAQQAVRSMQGDLYISNKVEGGARFELRWYKENADIIH